MRRCTLILSAALIACSLSFGQHGGGGHSGGGAHGHSSSGFTGFSRGATAPGVYSGAKEPTYSGYTGINPGAIPRAGRSPVRGYYPGFYSFPFFYSGFDDYSQPYYGYNNYVQDPASQTAEVTANLLGEQVGRLSSEVEQMREQSYPYAPPAYPAYRAPVAPPQSDNPPPLTLMLRDGSKLTLQSYAVMGDTFWDFSRQPARKIPFSSVDLAASQQIAEASGTDFPATR